MHTAPVRVFLVTSCLWVGLFLVLTGGPLPAEVQAGPLDAAVRLEAEIPANARTAPTLGERREGVGIVFDDEQRILTIGYLILEARTVRVIDVDGRVIPAAILGYDGDTGLGVLQALAPLRAQPIALGDSEPIEPSTRLQVLSRNLDSMMQEVVVLERSNFAGYWEYLLENAIFTTPAIPDFAGAGLVNEQGELVGVGSLFVRRPYQDMLVPGNMFVPTEVLFPILEDLIREGRPNRPAKPWMGITVADQLGRILVQRVSPNGPASNSGLQAGDLILKVGEYPVEDLETFFRRVWDRGEAGIRVPLTVLKGTEIREVEVETADRSRFYQSLQYD